MGECRMRIVAGMYRGRTLVAPKGTGTRPTSDRVREAVFSTLTHRFDALIDADVLDVFAGSGALGLEALSRGAMSATFVENDRVARAALERNISTLGVGAQSATVSRDAFRLSGKPRPGASFSLLFLDPPYRIEPVLIRELLEELACAGSLEEGAVAVFEHRTGNVPVWPAGFEDAGSRAYGETTVSYALWHAEKERIA